MIEIIRRFIVLMTRFINWFFELKIDLRDKFSLSLGTLTISFIMFVIIIKFVLESFGIIKKS